jgi:hypothetical protein
MVLINEQAASFTLPALTEIPEGIFIRKATQ